MKNEAKNKDMLDIMKTLQDYLGENYPDNRPCAFRRRSDDE